MRNPTLHDVARAAGVSYSTADRVLNGRGGVAEKSCLRVQRAIEELGYTRDIHAANLSRRRRYHFRFYLPTGDHGFFSVLNTVVQQEGAARAQDRIVVSVREVPIIDADALAGELGRVGKGECDCIAFVGADAARLDEGIRRLASMGIPAVALISDAANGDRALYVGINNVVAGRTAARLMRIAHGQGGGVVLPVLGSLSMRDHRDRLQGMQEVMREDGAALKVLPPLEVLDRPDLMRDQVNAAIQATPEISGIYSMGAGNRALISILRDRGPRRPFAVLHDVTPHSRAGLEEGLIDAIIDQKPVEQVRRALDAMKAIADGMAPPTADIIPMIYLKDNLPAPAGIGGKA